MTVIQFPGIHIKDAPPRTPGPDLDVVMFLERLLERARAGELQGIEATLLWEIEGCEDVSDVWAGRHIPADDPQACMPFVEPPF